MSSVTSWIRRRFDSTESDNEIPESPEPIDELHEVQDKCEQAPNSNTISYETETEPKRSLKVKSHWQRAVRKLSANSSGYGSGNDHSPSISTSGSRVSMEKPAWLLKQQALCQPRSRHMSINVDQVTSQNLDFENDFLGVYRVSQQIRFFFRQIDGEFALRIFFAGFFFQNQNQNLMGHPVNHYSAGFSSFSYHYFLMSPQRDVLKRLY